MTAYFKDFLVPDLGEGLEEATVTSWAVAVGDTVTLNQPLCSLETAKAEVEIPSPYAGRIVALRGEPGETLEVGTLLVRVDTAPEASASGPDEAAGAEERHSDGFRRRAVLVGYGVDEGGDRSRRHNGRTTGRVGAAPVARDARSVRPLAKPPVRKLARRLGVDLAALAPGSGTNGIITRADVEEAARATTGRLGGGPAAGTRQAAAGTDEVVPVRGVRARMAERMVSSRARIPDAHCGVTADCTRLLEVRARLRAAAEADGADRALTPFALLLRLVVAALGRHPLLNSTWVDEGPAIHKHSSVHLGFGAATERGLLVPVVGNAHELSTLELAVEVSRLVESARAGRLTPAELTGSTFTVSNFGALGLDEGVPVINYPEAAILGIGSIKPRPMVAGGELVARPTMNLTCAFDHRIADGADVAAFLCELRDLIEAPELALLRS
jgi:pyruvate dehydrogenase E2 component (dihydrolipoamide acetyltransferase)